MVQKELSWPHVLAEAGCFDFLEPVAAQAEALVFELCPDAESLVNEAAHRSLRDICLARLGVVYERPLIKLALEQSDVRRALAFSTSDEARARAMRVAAESIRDEVAADAGASLRAGLPLAAHYERAVASNFSHAVAEMLGRLLERRDDVSRELLDGRRIACISGFSADGDLHRHGRSVMRIDADAGTFYYKPHDCSLDALFQELAGTWLSDCARAARLVAGDGYAFVEQLVPEELACEADLRVYWRNFGCLAALFHGLGSRDMSMDNIMCCGMRPAVLDLETLLTAKVDFDAATPVPDNLADIATAEELADSVVCTSVLPLALEGPACSPLMEDGPSGVCLPRVGGETHTVRGYEQDFCEGFEEGYRRLMRHRDEALLVLADHADATCRQILLNTWSYAKARALMFSPGAMADQGLRDDVLRELNDRYATFSQELQQAVAEADATALAEGNIPYYCSRADARVLYDGDGNALGELLAESALELAVGRIGRLSEEELGFELELICRCLA